MTEEQKKARREYKRRWQQSHPDKCKQYQETFYQKKAMIYAQENAEKEKDE